MDDIHRRELPSVSLPSCASWSTLKRIHQATANYLVSLLNVYEVNYPGGMTNDNVKWRALIWALSEVFLAIAIASNFVSRKSFTCRSLIDF